MRNVQRGLLAFGARLLPDVWRLRMRHRMRRGGTDPVRHAVHQLGYLSRRLRRVRDRLSGGHQRDRVVRGRGLQLRVRGGLSRLRERVRERHEHRYLRRKLRALSRAGKRGGDL